MAGTIVEYPKRTYTFSALGLGAIQTITLEPHLSVGGWTEATALVRLFSRTVGTGASIIVEVRRTSPTTEDPSMRIVPATATLATVTIDSATPAAPLLLRGILPASFGDVIEITVKGTQATGSPQTITAELSVAMSAKGRARGRHGSASTPTAGARGCGM